MANIRICLRPKAPVACGKRDGQDDVANRVSLNATQHKKGFRGNKMHGIPEEVRWPGKRSRMAARHVVSRYQRRVSAYQDDLAEKRGPNQTALTLF